MPKRAISVEDRFAIADLFARYAWAYDTGDAQAMVALFTPDAVMEGMDGKRYRGHAEIDAFCRGFIDRLGSARTQHHNSQLLIEGGERQCTVHCYWMVVRWNSGEPAPKVQSIGYYISRCIKIEDDWYFTERIIRHWKENEAPWQVPLPQH